MLEQFLQFDRDLLIYLNNLGSDNWDLLWLIITDKLTFLPFFLIIIYFIYKKFTIKELLFILLTIALLILFTESI
jgi:undecaprenyl-diphosphatase